MNTSPHIEIRPARAEDFPQVQAICAQVWEGEDYVPQIWNEWLRDTEGELLSLTLDGKVIGLARLTRMGAREWWMEGLRIDPAYQRRGLGTMFHRYLIERFCARGGGVARFVTGSTNTPVCKMARALGFQKTAAFVMYQAGPQAKGADEFRRLEPSDARRVWDFLRASEYFEAVRRSIETTGHWTWGFLTEPRLLDLLQAERVYGWFGDRWSAALDGVVIAQVPDVDAEDGRPRVTLAYLDATVGNLAVIAQMFRAVVGHMGLDKVQFKTLARPERLVALEQAGYRRVYDFEIWMFTLESGPENDKGAAR